MNFFAERFGSNGFLNEHLWLGHLGHFLIITAFFAALLAVVAYVFAEYSKNEAQWKRLARASFIAHGTSVIGIFILLFIMILNHWFEYHYAWRHSSRELDMKYVISCFWEGQEGSFLLWEFWGAILGFILIKTAKIWENTVMTVVAVTQTFLASMVLGVYAFGYKIGSNPFVLLRDEMADAPIFQRPDYLNMIADGNGLNPLLQNYWMTIHPPVLFVGFASALIPFAYAIAALWRKDFEGWVKPALPWALFSVGILGTGILMGGAWAYESLSFGGFWAWDPVENMSFVPWLLLVAGVHLHLVYRYTKHGLFSAFLFYILGWLMVLYSTFLTRSGILGDTSVHAFTDLGMSGQLLIYMGAYFIPAIVLLAIRYKSIPSPTQEEAFLSREFWMFIGALVLLLSSVQMVFTTSIPVWNKLFHLNLAPPKDVVSHYNSIQIWLALIVALLTAVVQFFSYKLGRVSNMIKWVAYAFFLAILFSIGISFVCDIDVILKYGENRNIPFLSPYFMFLVAAVYAVLGNLFFFFVVLKRKWKLSGGSITHFGFGLFLVGVLISQHKKEVVSLNTHNDAFGQGFDSQEQALNVLLQKDSVYAMSGYDVTYTGKTNEPHKTIFNVRYQKKDNGKVIEDFTLHPNLVLNPRMGDAPNPSTKHYLTKDVFTHITAAADNSKNKDTLMLFEKSVGDTFYLNRHYVVFEAIDPKPKIDKADEDKLAVAARLKIGDLKGLSEIAEPLYLIDKNSNQVFSHPYSNTHLGLEIDINRINPETKSFSFAIKEKQQIADFVIMKAIVFPFINLVWLGGLITFVGIFYSAWLRRKTNG